MPKRGKNRWKGYTYEQKRDILRKLEEIRRLLPVLINDVTHSSHNTDESYNRIFELVESLYGELDIHNLTLDNKRRWENHKKMLREKGLTEL